MTIPFTIYISYVIIYYVYIILVIGYVILEIKLEFKKDGHTETRWMQFTSPVIKDSRKNCGLRCLKITIWLSYDSVPFILLPLLYLSTKFHQEFPFRLFICESLIFVH